MTRPGDLQRRGHSGTQRDAFRYVIDRHADGNPLRQTYPAERRVDVGDEIRADDVLPIRDGAGDAFDMSLQWSVESEQPDRNGVSQADKAHFRFLEIARDVEGILVHDGNDRSPRRDVVAAVEKQVGDVAVDG